MFQTSKRPRIYSIGVHGINRIVVERDAKYKEVLVKLISDDAGDYDFTVTVFTDKEGLPDVSVVDVTHKLDGDEIAPVAALQVPSMVQE